MSPTADNVTIAGFFVMGAVVVVDDDGTVVVPDASVVVVPAVSVVDVVSPVTTFAAPTAPIAPSSATSDPHIATRRKGEPLLTPWARFE